MKRRFRRDETPDPKDSNLIENLEEQVSRLAALVSRLEDALERRDFGGRPPEPHRGT